MTPALKLLSGRDRGRATFDFGRRPGLAGRSVRLRENDMFSHTLMVGTTGSGKTTAALSILTQAIAQDWGVVMIDLKGDPDNAARLAGAALDAGVPFNHFSFTAGERCDTWQPLAAGDPAARMSKVICLSQWSEPYYQSACERFAQLAFVLLDRNGIEPTFDALMELLDTPMRAHQLLRALRAGECAPIEKYLARLMEDRGQLSALAGLAARIGTLTDLAGPLRSTNNPTPLDLGAISRDGGVACFTLNSAQSMVTAGQVGALAVLDVQSMVAKRIATGDIARPMLIMIDEFSALDADHVLGLFARARSCRVAMIVATQELADLSRVRDGFENQILGLTNTKVVMRQEVPESAEKLAMLAGTVADTKLTRQRIQGALLTQRTGVESERDVERFMVDPNGIRRLNAGEAVLIRKGPFRVERVNITRPSVEPDVAATRAEPMARLTPRVATSLG